MLQETAIKVSDRIACFRGYADNYPKIGKDIFFVPPLKHRPLLPDRKLDVTILALTHGNEVAGLSVALEILRLLETRILSTPFNICFILGNSEAALAGKRFLQSDLNRSFGLREQHDTPEKKRALELESVFRDSAFLIDLHQTMGPCRQPFLISKLDIASLSIFRKAMPECAAVVYRDNFSSLGMTTLNYHLHEGGHGFGIELGQKGFDPWQIDFGVSLVLKTLSVLSTIESIEDVDQNLLNLDGPNFTFAETLKGKLGDFNLRENFENMSEVKKGEILGTHLGTDIISSHSGRILFPKYPSIEEFARGGTEMVDICRILRPISPKELLLDMGS